MLLHSLPYKECCNPHPELFGLVVPGIIFLDPVPYPNYEPDFDLDCQVQAI
jgi:hypothetical protein